MDVSRRNIVKFRNFFHIEDEYNLKNIWAIHESLNNCFWIGTYGGGLFKFDETNNQIVQYPHNPKDFHSLSNNNIWCIYEAPNKDLWIATSAGLNKLDSSRTRFTHYLMKDGLPNDCIYGILPDDSGCLWLSTNNGLCCFDPAKDIGPQFINYSVSDGLQSNEFNMGAFYKNENDELFFGGINGLNIFNPNSMETNQTPPAVILTDFKIFNSSVKYDSAIFAKKRIILSHKAKSISFNFASLDFSSPQKNQYAYKLEGFNTDWIYCNTINYATYTNLDPGTYMFKVKASNNDQIWNETGTAIKLVIYPPYWKTVWFKISILSLIISILFILHRYRVMRALEIERMRTEISSDLHDEIGTNISKIGMYSEIIRRTSIPDKIKDTSTRIGEISREIINTFGDIVWSIDARNDTVSDLIDKMQDLMHSLFSERDIQVSLIYRDLNLRKKLPVEFKKNIYLIFKEALNNVYKHSNATDVQITLGNTKSYFQMIIYDNGKVTTNYQKNTGQGLRNMSLRAEQLKGQLEITTNDGFRIVLKTKPL
jgi:signal transduction histidine kinase